MSPVEKPKNTLLKKNLSDETSKHTAIAEVVPTSPTSSVENTPPVG
jgi:hypothetical protein